MNSPNLNLKPFIYDFHDVREFLTSWLDWKRKNQKSFSMRRWARESGISVGFLPLMFSRKRILTEKILNQLMPSLKLRSEEQIYLKNLRVLSESTSLDEKSKALNQMQKAKKYKNLNSKNLEAYKYLTNWLHVAIREMTALNGFKLDEKWIQSKLKKKVPASKIKKAIQFLVDHEFIKLNKNGNAKKPEHVIKCVGGVYKLSMSHFHTQMLNQATQSIYETDSEKRYLISQTVAINPSDFDKIKDIMGTALEEIQKVVKQSQSPTEVIYITHLAFPLTKDCGDINE